MKKLIFPLLAGFFFLTSATISLNLLNTIEKDFKIKFTSKDPTGTFDQMNGKIMFDDSKLDDASFDLSWPISSINTANKMRDKKAQTSEWFNAAKFPNATFKSKSVTKSDKGGYTVSGTLSIKGISKSISFPMSVNTEGSKQILTGTFNLDRTDYKIGKPGGTVPNIMKVSYTIPISK